MPAESKKTIYFVGSGPGDPELITLKAKRLVEEADVVIYSGSLLNPKILQYAKKGAQLYDAAVIDREKIYQILRDSALEGKLAIRFHDGDPALFSAIREQIDKLEADGIRCKVVPGVTAILGAASDLNLELTLPGVTQTLIITRAELRTPVPPRESIAELARHGATMAFYLSVHLIGDVVKELLKGSGGGLPRHMGRREGNQGDAWRHREKDKGCQNNQDCTDNRRRRDCACKIRVLQGV
jgi:precorrin-4/cobalt-precorrin-4 C11-methyltransferase